MTLGRRLRRLTIEWWLVALLSSVFVLLLARSHATDRIDDLAYDGMLQLQTHEPDDRILLVVIDNRSLQHIGRWPWPRATHVRLLDRIAAGHPAAIVYDVLFVEPGPDDAALGQALARSAPVLLPLLTGGPGDDGVRLDSILPVPPVLRAAAGIGHVNLITDADGVVRRARLVEPDGTRRWPHLMELARRTVAPQTARSLPRETDSVLLPFAGPSGHFPSIGADAVLRGEFPPELLRNRIVIVGATAPGLGDRYAVPLSGPGAGMSGVEIQANLLDGLLRDGLATEAGFALRALAALIPLWLLLLALRKLRPVAIIPVLGGLVALVIAVSGLSFHFLGIWIPPTPALAGLALVYPLWGWRRLAGVSGYMVSELERLRNEPEILPTFAAPDIHADPIAREAMMLGEAVSKLRTMRRFVADSMDQLPDAVFVVDGMGLITLANRRAKQLLASLPHANASDRVIDLLRWLRPVDERNELVPWPPTGPASRHEAQMPDGRVFALAPQLPRLKALFDAGNLGVLLNIGTLVQPTTKAQYTARSVRLPPKLFSHNDQQSVWQASSPEGATSGWGGRIGDLFLDANTSSTFTCVSVSGNAVFMSGRTANQYQVSSSGSVRLRAATQPLFGSRTCSETPALRSARLVARQLCGMTFTAKRSAPASLTVSEMPSTAIEPLIEISGARLAGTRTSSRCDSPTGSSARISPTASTWPNTM